MLNSPLGGRRILSGALGSARQRAAAGGGWWDLDGTLTGCVAAYQPKGAASYAASKVNLANPGTYDLTRYGSYDPLWDTNNGWYGNGQAWRNDTLQNGYTGFDQTHSIIVRFSNASENQSPIGVIFDNADYYFCYPNYTLDRFKLYYGATDDYFSGSVTSGVFAYSTNDVYLNGTLKYENVGTITGTGTDVSVYGNFTGEFYGYVQATAVYNIDIAPYISALTTAMNAL